MGIFYYPVIYGPLIRPIGNSLGSVFTQIARLLFVSSSITGKNTAYNPAQWINLLLLSSMRILPSAGLKAPPFHTELLSILKLPSVNQTNYLASLGSWLKEETQGKKAHKYKSVPSPGRMLYIVHFHFMMQLFWASLFLLECFSDISNDMIGISGPNLLL